MDKELLTVDEVADILRTTPNTIYRWLRAGKFPGVKIGKEWRIKREALEERLNDSIHHPEQSYIEKLNIQGDHVMVLTSSQSEVLDIEVEFFKKGLNKGQRLFKGCWWQNQDEVRKELTLRGIHVEDLERQDKLVIADLADAFRKKGIQGPVEIWQSEAYKSLSMGYKVTWGSGSPDLLCCGDFNKLQEFENSLAKSIEKIPIVGICPYVLNLDAQDSFNSLVHLMNQHKGVLFYGSKISAFLRKDMV
ncbi:helix-turn-helix domain protein [Oxobacter pfennigii]|uniref:Helix-turn-helix domain protein n=1 Tax=Oxobacter pfennigii TaxID=36849 RepID=A0A0P8W9K6_9CLOT|nr:MEDS domain-containing protein [Oxobacter pfennigii]KPU45323.1 helix-turn-helix domain protein [Oxobacter pfennigii]